MPELRDEPCFTRGRKLLALPRLLASSSRSLFLLSHMRSRSTLLAHILGSNEAVHGYAELHKEYRGRADLLNLQATAYLADRRSVNSEYLLDKILHDYRISEAVLLSRRVKCVFLLRRPEPAIGSMLRLGLYDTPEEAAAYYCSRANTLSHYSRILGKRAFYIDSDSLIQETDRVLASLSSWLELKSPLQKDYSLFENTGKRHFGDSSSNIRTGQLQTDLPEHVVPLPESLVEEVNESYRKCLELLQSRCHGAV